MIYILDQINIGGEVYIGYERISDVCRFVYLNGIETRYIVTIQGNVYNSENMHKLMPATMPNGYQKVLIYYNSGKRKQVSIHRLVANAFIPNPNNLPQVNHIDGNKKNNNIDNLEWVTGSENIKHAFNTGLKHAAKGQDCTFAKTTDENVRRICEELVENELTPPQIAKKYSVYRKTVILILQRKQWIHVSKDYDFSHYDKLRKINPDVLSYAIKLAKETDLPGMEISQKTGISYSYAHILIKKHRK